MVSHRLSILLLLILLFTDLWYAEAFWFLKLSRNSTDRIKKGTKCEDGQTAASKIPCDENQLLLLLARLYITSPESIILLLSLDTVEEKCEEVADVIRHINATMSSCARLPPNNLYLRLYNGLVYYHQYICPDVGCSKQKRILGYHDCLQELREDLIDCEGPADWFEKPDERYVCRTYNEIVNCNYIKAAMLCGLTPALMLRSFSNEVMKRVVMQKCKVSRSLPHVEDPMPSSGFRWRLGANSGFSICFIFIIIYLINKYLFA